MSFELRLATTTDIPALRELIPVSVRGLSAGYNTQEEIESALTFIFGVDSQLISDGTYFVSEVGGQIVGAGGWSKRQTLFGGDQMKTEADPLLNPTTDAARIRAFYVHPDFARRGIGSSIIRACEAAAREAGFTRLELSATVPGEPLYIAMGYTVVERYRTLMPNGASLPAAKMAKSLDCE